MLSGVHDSKERLAVDDKEASHARMPGAALHPLQ